MEQRGPAPGGTLAVDVPGGTLAVDVVGDGPVVVLVHGGTSTATVDWSPVLPFLDGFRVVMFDHRGHGRSTGFASGIGMERFGRDLEVVLDHLAITDAAFVGFSVGANTLLHLVTRRPDLATALVLIGAGCRGRPERVESITSGPWLPALIDLDHVEGEDGDHWKRIRNALARDWADHHVFTHRDGRRITCPTLVLHGAQDRIEPASEANGVHERIPGSELVFVPGAGHMAQVDRPDVVGPTIASFLRRVTADTPASDVSTSTAATTSTARPPDRDPR